MMYDAKVMEVCDYRLMHKIVCIAKRVPSKLQDNTSIGLCLRDRVVHHSMCVFGDVYVCM